jgi:hypothetical protein
MAKFQVHSLEELIFRKYPFVCPYCRLCPHKDASCKTVRGTEGSVDHRALRQQYATNRARMPHDLSGWQSMFADIYPRTVEDKGRSTVGLLEELGELAEAIRVYERHPKYFAGEAADVFSYLMGIANEHALRSEQDSDQRFSLDDLMLRSYPGLCVQCGFQVCVCPAIPSATVGRMSKELDLDLDGERALFGIDHRMAMDQGVKACGAALDDVGGYSALAKQVPLDRGDANKALVLLFLELADAVRDNSPGMAATLNRAAIQAGRDATEAGARKHNTLSAERVTLIREAMVAAGRKLEGVFAESGPLAEKIGRMFQRIRVLVVLANPVGSGGEHIAVDAEARTIRECIDRAKERDAIHIETLPAATPDSLRRALLEDEYDILHFAGHSDSFGPVLDDGAGAAAQVPLEAIRSLLQSYPRIQCLILNSCLSLQACDDPLARVTIGMDGEVDDQAALAFAKGFYDALGSGRSIDRAIEEGKHAVGLAGSTVPLKVLL